ncbi:MAG: hypothetical protein KDD12_26470, partial [Lewinella sp.]|nr:hypothetical protein [Lewinella sp.]
MNPTPDGGFVMGGIYTPDFSPSSATILKLDGQGNLQWWKDIPGSAAIHGPYTGEWDLKPTADGGYIAVGTLGSQAVYLKLDSNAELVWSKTSNTGGGVIEKGYSVIEASTGGYYVGGSQLEVPAVFRIDENGEPIETIGFYQGLVSDLIEDVDGNIAIVGSL